MKQYSRTPLLITLVWALRGVGMIALFHLLGNVFHIFPIETVVPKYETVFLLDISKSMETDDVSPMRIEKAKSIIKDEVKKIGGSVGYVVFAGKVFVLSPLSSDRLGLTHLISETSTHTIDQTLAETSGTNIGDALIASLSLFSSGSHEKSIILFTDGRANIGLDPLTAIHELQTRHIRLNIVGIGSSSGAILSYIDTNGKRRELLDGSGAIQKGDLDRDYLESLARAGSGSFSHIENSTTTIKTHTSSTKDTYWDNGLIFFEKYQTKGIVILTLLVILSNWLIGIVYRGSPVNKKKVPFDHAGRKNG